MLFAPPPKDEMMGGKNLPLGEKYSCFGVRHGIAEPSWSLPRLRQAVAFPLPTFKNERPLVDIAARDGLLRGHGGSIGFVVERSNLRLTLSPDGIGSRGRYPAV